MPRKPIDYSKTVIYKIQHIEKEELLYVGSTTNFITRKSSHKSTCNNINNKQYNFKVYQMIRGNGGWDEFKMIEIEKFPCKDNREAEKRENEVMKELKSNMNSIRAYVTKEEIKEQKNTYKRNNRDKIKESDKKYRENNKDKINERRRIYYEKYKR